MKPGRFGDILESYCQMSVQLVNYRKSAAYFSKGTSRVRSRELTKMLGFRHLNERDKYLGNPIIMRRNKNSSSLALIDKVKYRMFSWQTCFLSQEGRSTLIKSVTTTIPVYNMSVLQLPPKTTDTMDKMFIKFF